MLPWLPCDPLVPCSRHLQYSSQSLGVLWVPSHPSDPLLLYLLRDPWDLFLQWVRWDLYFPWDRSVLYWSQSLGVPWVPWVPSLLLCRSDPSVLRDPVVLDKHWGRMSAARLRECIARASCY